MNWVYLLQNFINMVCSTTDSSLKCYPFCVPNTNHLKYIIIYIQNLYKNLTAELYFSLNPLFHYDMVFMQFSNSKPGISIIYWNQQQPIKKYK